MTIRGRNSRKKDIIKTTRIPYFLLILQSTTDLISNKHRSYLVIINIVRSNFCAHRMLEVVRCHVCRILRVVTV